MKVAATIVLLILASFPFLIAPWILLPILAGALVTLAIYLDLPSRPTFKKVVIWVKAISVGLAVAIALGFFFFTPWKPARTSVASKANIFISRLPGDIQGPASQTMAAIEADRLSLSSALQMERQRVTVVSRALNLLQIARAEHQRQENTGKPDEKLATALEDFVTLFSKERPDPVDDTKTISLLYPDKLEAYLAYANQAIDKIEAEGAAIGANSQDLRRFRLSIPAALSDFELDQLYFTTITLLDRLKSSLKVQLSAESTYTIKFNRDADTLTSQQDTLIRLSDNPVSDIDLTGFFTSKDGHLGEGLDEKVSVQEDSFPPQPVSPHQPVFRLRSGVNSILISKRIVRHSASEPVSTGLLPLQFSKIQVNWPLPSIHSLTLSLQERGNPNSTWPFILPIENKDDASLDRIVLPRYSFYFSDPAMDKISIAASSDELIPSSNVGNLRALFLGSNQTIRVEMLPRYLSNLPGQKLKDYLAVENSVASLIIWLITVVGLSVLKPKRRGTNSK